MLQQKIRAISVGMIAGEHLISIVSPELPGITIYVDVGQGEFVTSQFARDLGRGWTTFLAPTLGAQTQFGQARAFFRAVVPGSDFNDGVAYNNVIVTGHSLGGALAGYVDARANVKSFLVDPIPYGVNDNDAQRIAA